MGLGGGIFGGFGPADLFYCNSKLGGDLGLGS